MLIRFVLAAIAVLIGAFPALAAHLEITDTQKTEEQNPPQEILAPCTETVNLLQMLMVSANGKTITLSQDGNAAVEGDIEDCVLEAVGTALFQFTAEIMPDGGESPGDPVQMCVLYVNGQAAEAAPQPPYQAAAATGGMPPSTKPFSIKRNQRAVFLAGPNQVTSDSERIDELECQFRAAIGDMITVNAGLEVRAQGRGIGGAEAEATQDLKVNVGGCDDAPPCLVETTPAVSPLSLGAIAVLLASAGGFMIRVRVRRRLGSR